MLPSTRYEIKMVTDEVNLPQVRSWLRLHPQCFVRPYPNRDINNTYFDTPHLDSYSENLAGTSRRRKLRLRWYGSRHNNIKSVLELKCKRSLQGWKQSCAVQQCLDLSQMSWQEVRSALQLKLSQPFEDYLNHFSYPVLINQYHREYYVSFDRRVRITLDYKQRAYDQRFEHAPNLSRAILPSDKMVVEVKADRDNQHFLSDAIACLPLRVGKHSKYALSMEAILG